MKSLRQPKWVRENLFFTTLNKPDPPRQHKIFPTKLVYDPYLYLNDNELLFWLVSIHKVKLLIETPWG